MDAEATQLVKEVNNGLRVGNLKLVKAALAGKHCGCEGALQVIIFN
jgi:hypothetical protein